MVGIWRCVLYSSVRLLNRENHARKDIAVTTVFAMHQGPVPWAQVTALVEKAKS
jgi:hypothetical protein